MAVPRRVAPTFALVGALVGALACASTTSTTRELPTGMGTLGSYLDGCQPESNEQDGVMRMRCPDGVMVASRTRTVGIAEPLYRAEAYGMAQVAGGRLVWDQVAVATEGPSGIVDRARALVPGTDTPSATLVGLVRSVGANSVEEVWCTGESGPAVQRCADLLGVVLSGPTEAEPVPTDVSAAPDAPDAQAAPAQAAKGSASVTLFGRAVSLPTTCAAQALPDGADARCTDGASLSWRAFEDMDEAASMLHATLEALGDNSEGEAYPCSIAGESARCEEHKRSAAGLAYIDGKPVAVLCLGVDAARSHSLCKAIMVPVR